MEATGNPNSIVNETIIPSLPLSLSVVCDTYEAGQDMQNHDSPGEGEMRVPHEANQDADSMINHFISHQDILVCDKVVEEPSIIQP